jgi:hypothetical protein
MKNILKKQALGAYITLGAFVTTIVGLILYGITVNWGDHMETANGGEYYLIATDPIFGTITTLGVFSVIFLVLGLCIPQFKLQGIVGKVLEVAGFVFRLLAPVFLILTFVGFINGTLTGLGWTFFSNEELAINPGAVLTGQVNITGLVFVLLSAIIAIVASFFKVVKDDEAPAVEEKPAE